MAKFIMSWLELEIIVNGRDISEISNALEGFGASAVSFRDAGNQPIYEPSRTDPITWDKTLVIGLFPHDFAMEPIFEYLKMQNKSFVVNALPDKDWVRASLDSFQPLTFGNRICICPSWMTYENSQRVKVTLDPGLSFGTGTHETTALCLEWLDKHISGNELIIDYGCGSGILGIAALKLGAKKVWAIDHDPQALLVTAENRDNNNFSKDTLETCLPTQITAKEVDIVIANILSTPLITLAKTLANHTKKGGYITLSGILASQVENIITAYKPYLDLQVFDFKEEWVCLSGQKPL